MNIKPKNTNVLDFDNTPRWIVMLLDVFIAILSLTLAYFIRFDFYTDSATIAKEWDYLKEVLPFVLILKPIVFYFFKIHKGIVRHTSLEDVKRIFFALLTYSLIISAAGIIRYNFFDERYILPTSIIIVEFLASLLFMIGLRFSFKMLFYEVHKPKDVEKKNILIYGAGVSGL